MSSDVFLSHNSKDKPLVRQLNEAVEKAGLSTWLDEKDLVAGQPWVDAIEAALKSTRAVVVAIGENGLGPWETPEIRAALVEMVRRKVPVIPLLLPNAPAQVELPLFLQTVTWIDCRNGISTEAVNRIKSSVTGAPLAVDRQKPTVKKTPATGMQAFVDFCNNFQSSIGLATKIGFWVPILPIILGLEPPWDGSNKFQEKCSIGVLTLVVQVIAITSVFVLLRNRTPADLRRYFKWSLLVAVFAFIGYVISFILFTELQPDTNTRLSAGFFKTKEFYDVLDANNNDAHQSKLDFGFDPMRIYEPWTVWTTMLIVLLSWLAFFGSFIFYLGSFVHSAKEEIPLTDDRALIALELEPPIRQFLHSRGIETVGDLCATSPRQLKEMLDGSDVSFESVSNALSKYGINLRHSH